MLGFVRAPGWYIPLVGGFAERSLMLTPDYHPSQTTTGISRPCNCAQRALPPLMLSIGDTCEATGIKKDKLYEYLRTGSLPSVVIGRRRLIRRTDLEQWVAGLVPSRA